MATILSAQLNIVHDKPKKLANVTVKAKLMFTPYEVNEMKEGLKFKLKCELWGDDSGLTGADDKLFVIPTPKYFPDATPSALEETAFTVTVGEGVLDEDFGTDEVFAKLRLQNLFTGGLVTKKSNTISHNF